MKKYIYSIVAATALFASCSQDAELNEIGSADSKAITTIGASTEISTRAVVSSTENTKVYWEDGDQLGVLGTNSSSEAKNLAYTLNDGSGTTSGTFSNGSSDITAISAIMYPYQENATWANDKLTCEIPFVQTATKGSFDKAAAIMYSIGNTTDVTLNYAVNFLKVTVTEENVHSISISSTTTALSGKMEITSGGVAATSGSLNSVTLTAGKGNVLAAGDYYIAVKAGNIENPSISYVYYNDNHKATEKSKAGSGTLTFAENTNVKTVSVDFANGTVTTRKAVQLWANGPYFAEYNIG
ncbi:MAG: fimbrillin family protein, partial [Bacteroidaceae bacterium]|nr:fimbrillin family protein [Bacteroidaceae bacterium]